MSTEAAPAHPPAPGPHTAGYGLLMALVAACPATPSPYAPWVWGAVVVVIVVLVQPMPLKRWS